MTSILNVPPALIGNFWHLVEPGLEEAIKQSRGEASCKVVREGLEVGHNILLLALDPEGRYLGFAIIEPLHTARGFWVNVVFAWLDPAARHTDAVAAGFRHIRHMAKNLGALGVKAFSARPGMARLVRRLGMKQRFVEYVLED